MAGYKSKLFSVVYFFSYDLGVTMQYKKIILFPILAIFFANLMGCSAMQTGFSKSDLDVQTRMTKTIFLDPVTCDKKKVYIQIRNTSGKDTFNLHNRLARAIALKGYEVETNPDKAYYMVQINVLQISKVNLNEAESAFDSGFGGGLLGATVGGIAGANNRALLGAGLAGAVIGIAADAMVKDMYYTIITDVQLGERSAVNEVTVSNLRQGNSTNKIQSSSKKDNWKKYQTRIVSTANKVNLKLEEATPLLVDELVNSIAGLM